MQTPVATYVYASDPISQAGVISQLRQRPEVRVVDAEPERAQLIGGQHAAVRGGERRGLRCERRGFGERRTGPRVHPERGADRPQRRVLVRFRRQVQEVPRPVRR